MRRLVSEVSIKVWWLVSAPAAFDELAAEILFGEAGGGGGFGHHKSRAALFIERGVEELTPEAVPCRNSRDSPPM